MPIEPLAAGLGSWHAWFETSSAGASIVKVGQYLVGEQQLLDACTVARSMPVPLGNSATAAAAAPAAAAAAAVQQQGDGID
jgi:hypothetical protein